MNATNEPKTTNDDLDPMDLMDTLDVKKIKRRTSGGGSWVHGTMGGHRFDALVFPEHAVHPEYELDQSRISKLWVKRISDSTVVAAFERGWDLRPTTQVAEQIVELLSYGLAGFLHDIQ